jgi:hypothetical protein
MSTFDYFGHELTIDYLYSYARVSSPQQLVEEGSEGIQRQIDDTRAFSTKYGIPVDNDAELTDLGKSGSKGEHIKGGALGGFMAKIKAGKIRPRSGLIVESFSRLSRLHIDDALRLFFEIVCDGGVTLITLQDCSAYTQKSLRLNQGEIYKVSSAMQAARAQADATAYYSKKSWRSRRGTAANIAPSWIIKTMNGVPVASVKHLKKTGAKLDVMVDRSQAKIVLRIFNMAQTMGISAICQILNGEGVPTLNNRVRQRQRPLWHPGGVIKLLRGQQVLGLQEIGHMVEGKRATTGEFVAAYPPIISQELWDTVQLKLDSRKSGTHTGRNVTKMTNLFGVLVRCYCGERMKVFRRSRYAYLGCTVSRAGACDNRKFFRLDYVERDVLALMGNLTWQEDAPRADPVVKLEKQIDKLKADAADIESAYQRSMRRSGELAERTQAKLEAEYTRKLADVTQLERQLATLKSAKPADQELATVQSLSVRLKRLSGPQLTEARAKIAAALPALFRCLAFAPDRIDATFADGRTFRLGEWSGSIEGLIVSKTATSALFAKGITPSSSIAPLRRRTQVENDAAGRQSKKALNAYLKQQA